MNRPTFARQMFFFWRDTFKMGETAMLDTAPAFAAQLAVDERLVHGSCSRRARTAARRSTSRRARSPPAECTNNGPKAGVLTNPGVDDALLRKPRVPSRRAGSQETFVCTKFPAEMAGAPQDVGGAAPYTGVWPFTSRSRAPTNGGRINFHDTSAVICANCHQTLNHLTPLFAYYDARACTRRRSRSRRRSTAPRWPA